MLNVLSIKSHHETHMKHDDILKLMHDLKASFAESQSRKGLRLSLEETRLNEREEMFLKLKNFDFEERSSPGKAAELQNFLDLKQQKVEESVVEEVRLEHLDEIISKLSGGQASNPPPRMRTPRDQYPEPSVSSVSPPARRGRSAHHRITPREVSRTRSGNSGVQVVPALIKSTSHMSHSQSSASSKSSLRRKRDSSQATNSTIRSLRDQYLIDSGFYSSPSTSSGPVSTSNFSVQSFGVTTRPQANSDLASRLSLAEDEEFQERSRVPIHDRTQNITPGRSASNFQPSSGRYYAPTTQPNNVPPKKKQKINILVVSGNNMGKFPVITSLVAPNLPPLAVSKLAQTYFELLRLCSINTNSHWLFDRVESAGICINPKTDIDCDFAMRLLASSGFEYGDFPNEKDRLLRRIQAIRPAVFHKEYLKQFNYILCLDRNSYDIVNQASPEQQPIPSNQLIRGVLSLELDHLAGQIMTQIEAENVAIKIKSMVESVMEKRLYWKHPDPKLAQGRWRTLQMTIPREMVGRIIGKGGAKINALREDTGCSIQVFNEAIRADRSLILATGLVENLIRVEERILAVPAPPNNRRWNTLLSRQRHV